MVYNNNLKLCYVTDSWAWFTTCPLNRQWGDDWNDVPYEHNAGEPYEYREESNLDPYILVKVAWEGPYITPSCSQVNSQFSVQMINRGNLAWLRPDPYSTNKDAIPIFAGDSMETFAKKFHAAGGKMYINSKYRQLETTNKQDD